MKGADQVVGWRDRSIIPRRFSQVLCYVVFLDKTRIHTPPPSRLSASVIASVSLSVFVSFCVSLCAGLLLKVLSFLVNGAATPDSTTLGNVATALCRCTYERRNHVRLVTEFNTAQALCYIMQRHAVNLKVCFAPRPPLDYCRIVSDERSYEITSRFLPTPHTYGRLCAEHEFVERSGELRGREDCAEKCLAPAQHPHPSFGFSHHFFGIFAPSSAGVSLPSPRTFFTRTSFLCDFGHTSLGDNSLFSFHHKTDYRR